MGSGFEGLSYRVNVFGLIDLGIGYGLMGIGVWVLIRNCPN